jgi:hypothetical protein
MRADEAFRIAAAFLAVTCLGAAAPEPLPAASPPDAYAIFDSVRKTWGAGAYPRYAEYVAVVSFHNGPRLVRRSWETTEDLRTGYLYSHGFSREELANPKVPHGINVVVPFLGNLNKEPLPDPIGQVAFAIDQDYGLAPSARRFTATNTMSAIDAQRSALPVIGHTGTVARDYDVRLIEIVTDAQGAEYHLALTPLRDPARHRLRELWVDGATWAPEEAVVDGISSRPPLSKVLWRIEYRQSQGATYIAREIALAPVDYGAAGLLRDVTIAFEEVKLTSRRSFGFGFSKGMPLTEP